MRKNRREGGRKGGRTGGREEEKVRRRKGRKLEGKEGEGREEGLTSKVSRKKRCPTAATNDIMFQDSLEHAGANRDVMSVAGQPVPKLDSAFHLSPFCFFIGMTGGLVEPVIK